MEAKVQTLTERSRPTLQVASFLAVNTEKEKQQIDPKANRQSNFCGCVVRPSHIRKSGQINPIMGQDTLW